MERSVLTRLATGSGLAVVTAGLIVGMGGQATACAHHHHHAEKMISKPNTVVLTPDLLSPVRVELAGMPMSNSPDTLQEWRDDGHCHLHFSHQEIKFTFKNTTLDVLGDDHDNPS